MKPLYSTENYEDFCEYQKSKGLDKKYWNNLPQMWKEEQEFREEFEKAINDFQRKNEHS